MTRFERWTVWSSAAATAITGFAFFWAKYLVQPAEPWAVVNHPLEPWFLKTHIVFSPVFVFAIGLIVMRHIVPHIRQKVRDGRRSGFVMVWTLIPMAIIGYLIKVATSPGWIRGFVVLHVGTSVLFVAGLVGHGVALALRKVRQRDQSALTATVSTETFHMKRQLIFNDTRASRAPLLHHSICSSALRMRPS